MVIGLTRHAPSPPPFAETKSTTVTPTFPVKRVEGRATKSERVLWTLRRERGQVGAFLMHQRSRDRLRWKSGIKDKLVSNIPLSSPDGRHFPRNGLPVTGKVFFFGDKV